MITKYSAGSALICRLSALHGIKLLSTLLLLPVSLVADEPAAPIDQDAVVLSPFEVNSDKDTSYGATNSLTATRTARPINETPLAISVLTAEFLKDTGASSSFTDAFRYVPSVVPDNRSEGEGQNISGSVIGYARGFPLTGVMRNGVSRNGAFSLRNLERVEFLKGPVSVFFGAAEPGGTVNYITKKPKMRSYTNLELGVRSYELGGHETQQQHTNLFESTLEHEGVIGKDLGYRVYNFYSDGHGWRDNEYRREWTVSPSVLWKPSSRFQALVEYEHSRADSSPAAQTAIINPQYLADYANPPADVLAFHGRTADAYRARIFGSSQNWWVDTLSARGNTAAAALKGDIFRITNVGEGSFPGKPYDRASFSWQGKGAYLDTIADTLSVDLSVLPASWMTARYVGVYNDLTRKHIQSFRSEPNGDGTFNMASGFGNWSDVMSLRHQLDLVAEGRMLGIGHKLLIGGEYGDQTTSFRGAVFDYVNRFVAIPGRGGVTLRGLDAYRFWDPLLSPTVPDQSFAFDGWATQPKGELLTTAYYASWQGEVMVAGLRILPTVGYRMEKLKQSNTGGVPFRTDGDALTYGIVAELTRSVNVFASYNENYKPQVGVLASGVGVNRDTKGNLVPGLMEDVPSVNQLGKGIDYGFKFNTPDSRFSATINWFMVERDKLLANDSDKIRSDPRNAPGSFYPNPAPDGPLRFVDGIGFNPVIWRTNSGLQRNAGIEFDANWTPNAKWNVFTGVAYTYESKLVRDPSLVEPTKTLNLSRRLAATPEWKYSLWARYRFGEPASSRWVAGAGIRGQTSTNPRFGAVDKPEIMKGFTVFDVNVGYKFRIAQRPYDLTVNVTNLFDKLHGTGVFAYAEPRTARLQLSTQF